ncbi:MAG: RyR domain-containing protein [Bacteroides sp.]|nr:RyR domain-containing protein [Bacillota bacterium]MCM1393886.1 RyR domain-containing protein [[Eubacterium] siraeum]MCM1455336.1 RyR domain-containing protein [Bacteroides sp.]
MKSLNELSSVFFDELGLENNKLQRFKETELSCFRKSLQKFLSSGNKEDAFVVYYCFSEIFKLFGKGYDNTQKLLETLSDHEHHSGELLTKHRDHYSHSVYVFALGLAIFANDNTYKNAFCEFYKSADDGVAKFLYLWGMTALFHDIGYPFQLAHEQIKNYSEELWGNTAVNPYVSYGNMSAFCTIDKETSKRLSNTLNAKTQIKSLNELFAFGLKLREGYDEKAVAEILARRVEVQPAFMDHGYFSAVILAKQLLSQPDFVLDLERLDALTAILLHNNFNKFDAPDKHPIALNEHPLAYLLILCDELQSWDRLAYGKVSKRDPIAWNIRLDISDNEISAKYIFESSTVTDEDNKTRLNKSFAEIQDGDFVKKIKKYINSTLILNAFTEERPKRKKTNLYASDNSFINLCDFAKAIHASYLDYCKDLDADYINDSFEQLPLEFKISNIEQAKSYAYKLELINCFYSSKDLDYTIVNDFNEIGTYDMDYLGFLCREEHVRWVKEKLDMGWSYGTDYQSTAERNVKKIHKDIVPFEVLSKEEQKKDEVMINNIIPLLKKFGNNIRIYRYRKDRKPDLEIAGTGHRFFIGDRGEIKEKVKSILSEYNEKYRVIVRTCFAYGADQLIAECAEELGITTKAVIPLDYESYIEDVRNDCIANGHEFTLDDELKMRHLLAQTVVCKVVPNSENFCLGASKYLIEHCDKLIAIWDGCELPLNDGNGNEINRGGTYDCIRMARERTPNKLKDGEDIHIIPCVR